MDIVENNIIFEFSSEISEELIEFQENFRRNKCPVADLKWTGYFKLKNYMKIDCCLYTAYNKW